MERMNRRNYEDLIKTLQDVPGQARVPAENPPAEEAAEAEPPAVWGPREEQEHQEERSRLLEELQEQRSRLQEARALQEAKTKEKKMKRNKTDRTKYWNDRMAELEDQLTEARRRGQDWLAAVIVEEMAGIPARAAAAG